MPFVPEENSAGSACWKRDCTTEEIGAAKFKMTYTYKELDKKVQELITAGQGQMKRIQELERELKNHYHEHGVPEMTEEKRICPFSMSGTGGNNTTFPYPQRCIEEKCMAWMPDCPEIGRRSCTFSDTRETGNCSEYSDRVCKGHCRLIK